MGHKRTTVTYYPVTNYPSRAKQIAILLLKPPPLKNIAPTKMVPASVSPLSVGLHSEKAVSAIVLVYNRDDDF